MSSHHIYLFQKDEDLLLEPWIIYHSNLVGINNLHVFDNGSTNTSVKNILLRYGARGLHVEWEKTTQKEFNNKGNILLAEMRKHAGPSSTHIPLDCDEFIVSLCTSEKDISEVSFDRGRILDVMDNLPKEPVVNVTYTNNPVKDCFVRAPYQKVLIPGSILEGAKYLCVGYHTLRHKGGRAHANDVCDLAYLHFHHKPYDKLVESSKNKLAGRSKDFKEKTLRKYIERSLPGFHAAYHLLRTEKQYLEDLQGAQGPSLPGFRARLKSLGTNIPF